MERAQPVLRGRKGWCTKTTYLKPEAVADDSAGKSARKTHSSLTRRSPLQETYGHSQYDKPVVRTLLHRFQAVPMARSAAQSCALSPELRLHDSERSGEVRRSCQVSILVVLPLSGPRTRKSIPSSTSQTKLMR